LGQVWRNSGKNASHPQKFACCCSYTYTPNDIEETRAWTEYSNGSVYFAAKKMAAAKGLVERK